MRFFRHTLTAGGLALASLSTILISGGAANAAPCAPGSPSSYSALGATGCTIGDKLFNNFVFSSGFSTTGTESLTISYNPVNDRYTVSGSGLTLNPGSHTYSYTVTVQPPSTDYLDKFTTNIGSSDVPQATATSSLTAVTPNGTVGPIVGSGPPYTGAMGMFPNLVRTANMSGTIINTSTMSQIDTFTNSIFQKVPGPLPILGAGAAFGFSRKLKSRIKASA